MPSAPLHFISVTHCSSTCSTCTLLFLTLSPPCQPLQGLIPPASGLLQCQNASPAPTGLHHLQTCITSPRTNISSRASCIRDHPRRDHLAQLEEVSCGGGSVQEHSWHSNVNVWAPNTAYTPTLESSFYTTQHSTYFHRGRETKQTNYQCCLGKVCCCNSCIYTYYNIGLKVSKPCFFCTHSNKIGKNQGLSKGVFSSA